MRPGFLKGCVLGAGVLGGIGVNAMPRQPQPIEDLQVCDTSSGECMPRILWECIPDGSVEPLYHHCNTEMLGCDE